MIVCVSTRAYHSHPPKHQATYQTVPIATNTRSYHGAEALYETSQDLVMWDEAIWAKYDLVGKPYGRGAFDQLLGHCMATTDWPQSMFAPGLLAVSCALYFWLVCR